MSRITVFDHALHTRPVRSALAAVFSVVTLALLMSTPLLVAPAGVATKSTASAAPCLEWTMGTNPGVSGRVNVLSSAGASSRDDVWAVGYQVAEGSDAQTLAMHWDGKEWKVVPSPNPNSGPNYLESVATLGPNNAWAVGYSGNSDSYHPIILHWDGTAWTSVAAPAILNETSAEILSIAAVSATDIWAVGDYGDRNSVAGAILHWNGNEWGVAKTIYPTYYAGSYLSSVVARSANDVWAIGVQGTLSGVRDMQLRWNGSDWQEVSDINAQQGRFNLYTYDVAFAPSGDRWLVGVRDNQPLIMHYTGSTLETTGNELRQLDYNFLNGVTATGPTEAWAVGYSRTSDSQQYRPLMLHTVNGVDWNPEGAVNPQGNSRLNDIIAIPNSSGEIVTVGTANGGALIGMLWDKCAIAVETPTPPPPVATPTPAAPTAVPTFAPTPIPGDSSRTFPETGKSVKGTFLDYWAGNGGLAQQGYPISDMFTEISALNGKPYTVQYFERAVFEYHPENQAPYNVLLSQLGTFQYKHKYPTGAPGQTPNTSEGSVLSAETGHRVGGKFLDYWQKNGGLAQQGYPISDEFTEKSDLNGQTYTVQYFERAVFELHPENQPPYDVLLSQLGTFQYKDKYAAR
jgi:hypothetical protein